MLPHIPERQASVLHTSHSNFQNVPQTPVSPIGSPLRHSTRLNANFGTQMSHTVPTKSTNSVFSGSNVRASSPARVPQRGLFAGMPTSPDRMDTTSGHSSPQVPLESQGPFGARAPTGDIYGSPTRNLSSAPSQQFHQAMSQRSPGTSFQARIDYACNMSTIADRCEAIKILCQELSMRDLANNLYYLLNLIFCLDKISASGDTIQSQTSLCIGCVTTRQQSRDAHAIIDLLRPDGILFEILYGMYRKKLNVSTTAAASFQRFFKQKQLGTGQKSSISGQNRTSPSHPSEMSGFELYFLAFSTYGLCMDKSYEVVMQNYCNLANANRGSSVGASTYGNALQKYTNYGGHLGGAPARYVQPQILNRQEVAYNQLLLHYTRFFLPLDLRLPNLIKTSSHTGFVQKQQAPPTEPIHFSPIFKPNAFKIHQKNSLMESLNSQRASSYVQSGVIENGQFIVALADIIVGAMSRIWFSEALWPQRTGYMLYEEHVRNLRLVVKHVISFVTIDTQKYQADMKTDAYAPEILAVVQGFQNNVLQRHIQPHMYPMLSAIFECWNMPPKILSPSYFRTIVELWLTYIQPWRYNEEVATGHAVQAVSFFGAVDAQAKQRLPDNIEAAQIWLPYISANLYCYTTLFEDILRRAMRVDLSAQQECTILFRSLRVFSQANLLQLIAMAGEQRVRSSSAGSSTLASPTSPHLNGRLHGLQTSPDAPFARIGPTVQALMSTCQEILAKKFKFYRPKPTVKPQTWLEWLYEQFSIDPSAKDTSFAKQAQQRENEQISSRLDQSIELLSSIFGIDAPEPPIYDNTAVHDSPQRCLNKLGNHLQHQLNESVDEFAEFELDDGLTEVNLTQAGLEQLLSSGGHIHAPIVVNTHYDDLPCMSMELGILLFFTRLLGRFFTAKAQPYLENVENGEPGLVNNFGRYWFQTAPNGLRYKHARISVRFLAHASFWFYFTIAWLVFKLAGSSMYRLVFYSSMLLLCYMAIRYLLHKPLRALLTGQKSKSD